MGADHACEYVPGDPHCVVCYEMAGAGGSWAGVAGEAVILPEAGPAVVLAAREVRDCGTSDRGPS